MVVGFVIIMLNCAPGGQFCSPDVFPPDDRQIYTTETECNRRVKYYQEIMPKASFDDQKYLVCGEVSR